MPRTSTYVSRISRPRSSSRSRSSRNSAADIRERRLRGPAPKRRPAEIAFRSVRSDAKHAPRAGPETEAPLGRVKGAVGANSDAGWEHESRDRGCRCTRRHCGRSRSEQHAPPWPRSRRSVYPSDKIAPMSRAERRARRQDEREANERQKEEERRRRKEEKNRDLTERAAAKERKEAERAERKPARTGRRHRVKDSEPAENAKRRQKGRRREAAERSDRERLAPDMVARIRQYGVTPDERRDAEAATEPPLAKPSEPEDPE